MLPIWLLPLLWQAHAAQHVDTLLPPDYDEANDNGTFGYYPSRTFVTEDSISAPMTNWLQWDPQCDDGTYYFLTPRGYSLSQPQAMILDGRGELIWSKHFANDWGGQAYDLKVQHHRDQQYLTLWTGDDQIRGHGSGTHMMLNSSYDLVREVDAANDMDADLHEFLLTADCTALLTVYEKNWHNLSGWRSFNATLEPNDGDPNWIWDCVFQEVSMDTDDVLFEWRASDHVNIHDTYHLVRQAGNHEDPFDWFHMNSVRKDELGNYLISARYTHSIIYVDGRSGEVIWTLGGKRNMFMDLSNGSALNFAWQHDAHFVSPKLFKNIYTPPPEREGHSTRLLTLFDNAAEDQNYVYGTNHSRGLLLEITFPTPSNKSTVAVYDEMQPIIESSQLTARDAQTSMVHEQDEHNSTYPLYGHNKLQDLDADRLKTSQINGSSPTHTVRVIQSYHNPSGVRSSSQGSMHILPPTSDGLDTRVLVGYGLNAVFTEFKANGSVTCDAHYGAVTSWERGDIQSYRVYKQPWVGLPRYQPRMVVDTATYHAFVSWNGATEVATWVLQARSWSNNDEENQWMGIVRKRKLGFETAFDLTNVTTIAQASLRVLALDADDQILDHGITDAQNCNFTGATLSEINELDTGRFVMVASTTFLFLCCFAVSALVTLYEMYRRYLCWKVGGRALGSVRWRKTSGYRLLGDV